MRVEIPEWNRYEEIKIPHSMSLSESELLEYRCNSLNFSIFLFLGFRKSDYGPCYTITNIVPSSIAKLSCFYTLHGQ